MTPLCGGRIELNYSVGMGAQGWPTQHRDAGRPSAFVYPELSWLLSLTSKLLLVPEDCASSSSPRVLSDSCKVGQWKGVCGVCELGALREWTGSVTVPTYVAPSASGDEKVLCDHPDASPYHRP